jgi:glycosyltransferase involved in cell wall biosynthesis
MAALSVLFSTFNGAATLPPMLDALEALQSPPGGWKLIAVDNGSTDTTAPLLRERQSRLPLTVLSEPRRGKNVGLNAGLDAIEGDLVIFTDDDVVPPPDWLVAFRRLADAQPDFDIFGGAIRPRWLAPPPDWILRCAPKGHFAWTEFESGPIEPRAIWGPNMAVRRAALGEHRFHEGIGPNGAAGYATGSEIELVLRLAAAGHRCWHAEDIVALHLIEPRQLTAKWLLQRSYNQARGEVRLGALCGDGPPADPPLRRLGRYATALAASFSRDPDARFLAARQLAALRGDRDERRAQARSLRTAP